ncbi:NodT family efflux transporter outer membrane factor (OMF) lipoprotein [Acinetobacter baylyi]|uniref:NodT family efflux transporter outer membrane factor (OMF) lipoprotein n=1 Tax=Acinetobacter baylyi TaxID=202950 RepID=A0ABU0UWM6_ACIBI|nr:efflux transporter outer membrane subunit [Acinetobacter baylyi]MDQ1208959.1 NodT family efflux transporter outer membrane factor (OMF) lipoprotein [Acinetobacter baylyi]MDR6107447.1 NodT family efflux transporter outer membrane factor (OMF) lipoprotein [Acinetobacter baylyi]MDR6185833.1 NodT family efflux transporter outer membrane factor (OMF) lipoprotein [Acinetobacter baylyi]
MHQFFSLQIRVKPSKLFRAFSLGVMGVLSGCQMVKPEPSAQLNIQAQFSQPAQYGLDAKKWETEDWKIAVPSDHLPRGEWWQIFQDTQLNQLVEQLKRENASIAQYEAQYRQATALLNQATASTKPTVTGNTNVTRVKSGESATTANYNMGLNASWEPDFWGKVRQNIWVNQDKAQASEAELNSIRLSMQAQLTSSYLQWVILGFQRQSQQQSLKNLQKFLQLTHNQYQAGIVASTTVDQAQSQYQTALANYTEMQLAQIQLQHAIAMLIGQPQNQLQLILPKTLPMLPQIPVDLPSSILQRRPDVAAAERTMAAANAQVGVAKLAVFPDFSLGGNLGYKSSKLSNLFSAPNFIWSVGPTLAATLFDGGLRHAQTEQAKASYDASAAVYKQTVMSAIQNVEDNIAAQYLLSKEVAHEQQSLAAATRAEQSTTNQYKAGIVGYLNVLTAQNNRLSAQNSVWSLTSKQYQTTVNLISAMGGSF